MPKSVKKIIDFYNSSGSLDNVVKFLETIQKKLDYINLTATVDRNRIRVVLYGPRDLQYLASERLRDLAKILE